MMSTVPARYINPKVIKQAGFGDGPLSGNRGYWLGCRYLPGVSYMEYADLRTALGLDSPKGFDLTHLWWPMGTKPSSTVSTHTDWYGLNNMTEANAWNWMRGGVNDDYTLGESSLIPTATTHAPSGGSVMRRGQWPRLWDTFLASPCILNLALVIPQRSAKIEPPDPYVWQDIAAGAFDNVWDGLGFRFAYKDSTTGKQVFPAAGERLAPAHTFINVGWENDSAQAWSIEKIQSPASPLSGYAANAFARDYYWTGISRIVTAFMTGYHRFDGWNTGPAQKNCPYFFSHRWRQAGPREAGTKARDLLWNVSNPGLFQGIGVSMHDNKDSFSRPCTITDPDGMWLDKNDTNGNLCFEGMLSFGELCDKHSWKMINDEWASHHVGGFTGGPYPDYFYLSSDRFFKTYPDLAGAYVYFYGDETTDLLTNHDPDATTGPAIRHEIAKKTFLNLYKNRSP